MELFQIVDTEGRPIGSAPRSACHGTPSLIHLVVHLHLFDPSGRLYLQRRSMSKDTNPGQWDTSVGGHVMVGEAAADALIREAREELGIDASGARHLYSFLYRTSFESELAQCYSLAHEGPMTLDPDEIMDGRFFTREEIERRLGSGFFTPMFEHEYPTLARVLEEGAV